jgi:cyclase
LHLGPSPVEIYFPGKAHTSGDALVYFPRQQAIAMGDLFLNRSSPAMDVGSAESWIHALDHVLELPVTSVVPGHFELGTKADLKRFRDYLNDLYEQVRTLKDKGETIDQVRRDIHMQQYSDFRQYPKFEATFSDNAASIYRQLKAQ